MFGVFDGHGPNGHIVSNLVKNRLPSLLLGEVTAKSSLVKRKSFNAWKEAFETSFKVMDKEIKLQENLDGSCSGSTAVVMVKQVMIKILLHNNVFIFFSFLLLVL